MSVAWWAEPSALDHVADTWPSPSEIVSRKEEMELLKNSLSDEEHQIFELRRTGLSWNEIATRLGGSSQSRRMQLSRGLDRLELCLGHVGLDSSLCGLPAVSDRQS